jgi:hypothetical protein
MRHLILKEAALKKSPSHTPWHISELPINVINSSFMGKLKAGLFASRSELSLYQAAPQLLRDRISLYTFAPPSHKSEHKQNYDKLGEHQAKLNNDIQVDEIERHRTRATPNIDYSYIGNDSPEAIGKTIVNMLIFLRLLYDTPDNLPNEHVSDLMGLLSGLATSITHITTNNTRRSQLRQVPNGIAFILQTATNLVATAAEIAFNPDIRRNIKGRHQIYDNHAAFNEYLNLSQVIQAMTLDLGSANPTFQCLHCPFLQLPCPAPTSGPPKSVPNKAKKRDKDGQALIPERRTTRYQRANPVNWVDLKNDDPSWKISAHQCLMKDGSSNRADVLCWSHIANNRSCNFEHCKQRHPSKPADIGSICDAKKVISWIDKDPTLKWVGNARQEFLTWISSKQTT